MKVVLILRNHSKTLLQTVMMKAKRNFCPKTKKWTSQECLNLKSQNFLNMTNIKQNLQVSSGVKKVKKITSKDKSNLKTTLQ